jgi:hypothetical protein
VKKKALSQLLKKEIQAAAELFTSLWPGYEEEGNTVPPHRQRTSVNKLAGYALFLGLPMEKGDPTAGPLRTVRAWQKRIGALRDCDVMGDWIRRCVALGGGEAAAAGQSLEGELQERRTRLLALIRLDARGLPGAETRVALQLLLQQFGQSLTLLRGGDGPFDWGPSLEVVGAPWREALELLRVDMADDKLHAFRVKNKRLRFVLELLAEAEDEGEAKSELVRRAKSAAAAHTALGNLSDLHVLRDVLRLARASWAVERPELAVSAAALELGRATLEAQNFDAWFAAWGEISRPDFLRTASSLNGRP